MKIKSRLFFIILLITLAPIAIAQSETPQTSEYYKLVGKWILDQGFPLARSLIRPRLSASEVERWDSIEFVVANGDYSLACSSPLTPAASELNERTAVRSITVCARSFRFIDDIAYLLAFAGIAADNPEFQKSFEKISDYLSIQLSEDSRRMRSGQEPLTICKLEFLFFQSITGRDPRRCKISDESADFNKWWNSDNLASPTMRGFLRDRVGLELNDTRGLREFLDRSHANWLATMLACLMLHEFAHHLHGDIGHGTETDAARQAREVAADNYAVSFTQRVPESDDLWKDFFRINLTSAYAMNSFFMLVAYKYDRQSLPDSDERFRISGRYFLKMLELVKTDPEFLKLMPVSVTELNTIRQSVEGDLRDQMKK